MAKMIYCCGADGSGKSTYLREIELDLNKRGFKTCSLWIRSPKILSKPLMLYCHLIGLTKYRYIDGFKFGNHSFEKSLLVRSLFPVLQLIDFKLKWALLKRKGVNANYILMDRFVVDTLIDLMVSTKRFDLFRSWIGKSFFKMLPSDALMLCFDANAVLIRSRKADTQYDVNLDLKLNLYRKICDHLNIVSIVNSQSIDHTRSEVLARVDTYLVSNKY